MRKRETKTDSVRIFGNVQLFGDDNKSCCVLVIVLKMIVKNLQAVFLTRFVWTDCRNIEALFLCNITGGNCRVGERNRIKAVVGNILRTLWKWLRMRPHDFNVLKSRLFKTCKAVVNRQIKCLYNVKTVLENKVINCRNRACAWVFNRKNTECNFTVVNGRKYICKAFVVDSLAVREKS